MQPNYISFRNLPVRIAALFLITLSASSDVASQERAYLDTTQAQIRQRKREPTSGTVAGSVVGLTEGLQVPAARPLTLSLQLSGRAEFSRAEPFEYEIRIQNAAASPIELPWNLNSADIEPADSRATYQYEMAAIWLDAKLGANRMVTLDGPITLFGSSSIRSTTIKLKPGEWVRIRAKARAIPSNPGEAWPPSGLNGQVEGTLTATLTLSTHTYKPGIDGSSHEGSHSISGPIESNELPVRLLF